MLLHCVGSIFKYHLQL